ncbi:uncharacterized protein [Leptinotarsa decemlineata]|uniref:uncharacterized protein n=2 Tax=Leptinotarsa decemlineata TaxID=7539 RepID=UPI003D30A46E
MQDDHEFNIHFVTLVEAYPCLYDNTREDYHMSHVQERAWSKIAKDIGKEATVADCKKRWKNLRGSYTKHLKTYVPSGSGASVKRPYYLSEYICFVLPFTKSRQPKGNVGAPKDNEAADILDEEIFTEDLQTEELESEQLGSAKKTGTYENNQGRNNDSDGEQSITEEVDQNVSNVNVKNDSRDPKQGKQKRSVSSLSVLGVKKPKIIKNTQNQVTLEDVNKSALEYFNKKKEASYRPPALTNDDADVQFLLSLLPDLKKMTDKQKRKYKVGVLNLAGEILDEPLTSAPLFSPTPTYSSLAADSMSSIRSSAACTNCTPPRCETADSQPSYEDISFSTVHQLPTQDTLLPNSQYSYLKTSLLPDTF